MTVKATPVDVLSDFKVSAKRAPIYTARDNSPRVSVPAVSDAAYVTRGAHKSGAPVLLVQDGSSQQALPLAAIGAAIAGGVISSEEIAALTA